MPELPEVEAARKLAQEHLVGKRIVKVTAADDLKLYEGKTKAEVEKLLRGNTVTSTHRKGKQMWWKFKKGPEMNFQFGMTGNLLVQGEASAVYQTLKKMDIAADWPPRFCRLHLELEDGTSCAFSDSRRFAKIRFAPDVAALPHVKKLGFDCLNELPALEDFAAMLAKKRTPVKAALLNQNFTAGVGNWVADEVLYQARVHPEVVCAELSGNQAERIHESLGHVVQFACDVNADDELFPDDWLFHYRWTGKRTSSVMGHRIDFITVGSRTSAFCPSLQKRTDAGVLPVKSAPKKKPAEAKKAKKAKTETVDRTQDDAKLEIDLTREETTPLAKRIAQKRSRAPKPAAKKKAKAPPARASKRLRK